MFTVNSTSGGIVAIIGDLKFSSIAEQLQIVKSLVVGQQGVKIDLHQVGRVDSAGIAWLVEVLAVVKQQSATLTFINIPATLKRLLPLYNLETIFVEGT